MAFGMMNKNGNHKNKQQTKGLYETLSAYCAGEDYPCHMPGHKRNSDSGAMADFYRIDITEIDGFDNLHQAQGILKEAQERANRLYGAQETYYLVNGSTCGVLAAILSVTRPGDEILTARNCHKAVYHAMIMQGLTPRYYYPGMIREYDIYDGVSADKIGRLLEKYPACRAVVITSPTYEGIISDVEAVARVVHAHGKILIVDEAHGAHLGLFDKGSRGDTMYGADLSPCYKKAQGAVAAGADLVIHSLHKTLPAMTQTALLHVNGALVDRDRLRRYLAILQSSSPSYVLMASMDSCVRYLEEHGQERVVFFQKQYAKFCQKISSCKYLHVGNMTGMSEKKYSLAAWDIGKIIISVKNTMMHGVQLYNMLREEYHLQMEMAADSFVLAMMTWMDTEEGWQRLADAICAIDDRIEKETCCGNETENERQAVSGMCGISPVEAKQMAKMPDQEEDAKMCLQKPDVGPEMKMTPAQAFHSAGREVLLQDAAGNIAAGFINLYPPGVPLVVPGEVIDQALIKRIHESMKMGLQVQGVSGTGKVNVAVRQEI